MPTDPAEKAAYSPDGDEPEWVTREWVKWSIYDPAADSYLFTGDRIDCERWMNRLAASRPTVVLVRQDVRSRSQTWFGDRQVIPWHSACDWIAQGDENGRQIGDAWCTRHHHREGTPVPPEHVRGQPETSTIGRER